jgi:hypothetical protein
LLPRDLRLKGGGVHRVRSNSGNPLAPQTKVQPGALSQRPRQAIVVVTGGESQCQKGVAAISLDLRCQHAGGCTPGLAHLDSSLDYQHFSAG